MSLERALKRSLQERNKVLIQKSSGKDPADPSKKLPLHLQTGKYGEEKAAEYLTHIGDRIIAKNVSCRHGEIDIIADDGNEIVFVEVRTRSFGWLMPPECTVGPEKIKKLKKAARIWTENIKYTGFWRIDLVAITLKEGSGPSIEHIKDITEGIL
ncbi:MAG: YraN family protein [Synergistaceae bacterium]|nr:YraN family protein [Synergistaceae bacterium]